ncbi:hypothetical protein J6590_081699 [Homalodisca vitripennis]|nr:hypothetical protein J6590_081699 [Homalodisca vitripennis]
MSLQPPDGDISNHKTFDADNSVRQHSDPGSPPVCRIIDKLSAYLCRMHTALSPDTARQSSCRCCNPTPLAAGPMRTVSMPRRD